MQQHVRPAISFVVGSFVSSVAVMNGPSNQNNSPEQLNALLLEIRCHTKFPETTMLRLLPEKLLS